MKTAYKNMQLSYQDRWRNDLSILCENGKVAGVVQHHDIPGGYEQVDVNGKYLSTALIDLQIYGGSGKVFLKEPTVEAIAATYKYCLSGGAAHFMITLPTIGFDIIDRAIEAVHAYWQQGGKGLLGLHLEGPFINAEKKGAHLAHYITLPTLEQVQALLAKANGAVKMMTVAPEKVTVEIVQALEAAGVLVSAGHSNATYDVATKMFNDAGIPAATHLFNAMSPLESRAPGIVGAIYDHDTICSSVVADGVHVSFDAIRISKKIMGPRLFLITDAVDVNESGDYIYLRQADRFVTEKGILAGSCLTMLQAVKNCVEKVGIPAHEALRMGSTYPAKLAQKEASLGTLHIGADATFVLFDEQFQPQGMIIEGELKD
ncbi:N-acetylglucosamine-6-phosphate deacetylase [Chitinophaga skermanii]|uniref:N-acetylglucosamine-6-phosphate deacetylase n=1 Tax=Chitinophaga skermanii TaxID=331697 RepID=A0A327R1D9_9BACT|nr:N-acetylglucosamine-6-phosphate deacetylase [Chitinophaga skermanii]RAJ10451.1 N-acetylglucosamine-6-phosphate deacetylase [Chitinophaga skermanii]